MYSGISADYPRIEQCVSLWCIPFLGNKKAGYKVLDFEQCIIKKDKVYVTVFPCSIHTKRYNSDSVRMYIVHVTYNSDSVRMYM